jgi:glyoxylase-like metal-dependent hydrolase (beta-lactamase superfamily II)
MDVQELRPGLWRWTAPHPAWRPGCDWPRDVGCVFVEARDATVVVDPLVPADEEERFWSALDRDVERRGLPVVVLLTCTWHRRSAGDVARRYDAAVWRPDDPLPHAVEAERFAAGEWEEHVFVLADHAALLFGDVVEGDGDGGLRMPPSWWPPAEPRTQQVRAELRRLLERPVELVVVSHGDPVVEGAPAALERALAD